MELRIKEHLFDIWGITIAQTYLQINEDTDINIYGSISCKDTPPMKFRIQANMCNAKDDILYVLSDFSEHSLEHINYEVFHIFCNRVTRFVALEEISYVELYPSFI